MTRRRARGEGTIRQRPDGRWEARLPIPGGARRSKSVYGRTQTEVLEKIARVRADLAGGIRPTGERLTVGAHLTEWLESVRPPNTRHSTFDRYEAIVRLYLLPALGRIPLARLEPADVERLLGSVARTRSHRTASHVRAVLRTALNRAVRHRRVAHNAASDATWRQPPTAPVRVLDDEERQILFGAIAGDPLEPLYRTAIGTGARQGELLGLRWSDVDLDERTITIRQQLQRVDGELVLVPTKTERSRRTVDLYDSLAETLRRHKVRQAEALLSLGRRQSARDYVFLSEAGTPLDGSNVTKHLQVLLARAGAPRIRFHDLRHLTATVLLEEDVDIRVVADILGHSTTRLTHDTYQHVIPRLRSEAVAKLARGLGG